MAAFMSQEDSLRLVSQAQSGDCQAFADLVEPHLRRIYATARKITKNHEDAEDACQQSVMKAFLHINHYQGNAKFSTWLTRIVINEALMTVRKTRTEGRYLSEDVGLMDNLPLEIRDQSAACDPESLSAQIERKALLRAAIGQLDSKARSAVCLLGLEERGTSETAELCRVTHSGLRSRFQRALRQLRVMLSDKLGNSLPLRVMPCETQE
jgi:RNA polymerase sigma-70 factor (ECF subfamily)